MTPQPPDLEAERRKKEEASNRGATSRAENSPDGMRIKAQGLRDRARGMSNPSDREAMLRLASEFERRAKELETHAR